MGKKNKKKKGGGSLQRREPYPPSVHRGAGRVVMRMQATKTERFEGPIPSPEAMQKYEALVPGAAKTMMDLLVQQTNHRHDCERRMVATHEVEVHAAVRQGYIGQVLSFLLFGGILGTCVYLLQQGQTAGGLATLFGSLAIYATAFWFQRSSSKPKTPE